MENASSDLASFIVQRFEEYRTNREAVLESRWRRNKAAFDRDAATFEQEAGTWKSDEGKKTWQSTTFFGIIRQKVNAVFALLTDVMFPGGKLQYLLQQVAEGPLERMAEDQLPGTLPAPDGQMTATESEDLIALELKARMDRELDASDAVHELERCVRSGEIYGMYWAKRYITPIVVEQYVQGPDGRPAVRASEEAASAVEFKSVWSMYWDLEDENIQSGSGLIEFDPVSAYELALLADSPVYSSEMIALALRDSTPRMGHVAKSDAEDEVAAPRLKNLTDRQRTIRKLEFWGRVPRRLADAYEKTMDILAKTGRYEIQTPAAYDPVTDASDQVEIFAVLAGPYIVAFRREPGPRPYYLGHWQRDDEVVGGVSLADEMVDTQKVLNGLIRAAENNTKLAGNIIFAGKAELLQGDFKQLSTGMWLDLEYECDDVRQAVQQIKVDPVLQPILELLQVYMEFADLESGVPRAEQGQQTGNAQTAFELQQRLERSGKQIGRVVKNFDRFHQMILRDFYDHIVEDPAIGTQKGVYQIKVLGYRQYENQVVRLAQLMQLLAVIQSSPELQQQTKVRWLLEEIAKARGIEVDQLLKSPADMQAEAQAQAESPQAQLQEAMAMMMLEEKKAKVAKDQASAQATIAKAAQGEQAEERQRAETVDKLSRGLAGGKPAAPEQETIGERAGVTRPLYQNPEDRAARPTR